MAAMASDPSMREILRKLLNYGDLTFRDFMEVALYHPVAGYYTSGKSRVGKGGDYVTAPTLSPAFPFALAELFREFVRRHEGALCSFVDIGCGDGSLVRGVARQIDEKNVRFFGVDRSLSRVEPGTDDLVKFLTTIDEVPRDGFHLVFSSELFDALPFARVVQRGEHLHELWVSEREGALDWSEHEAPAPWEDYFTERGIELSEGQFADISLEWGALYGDIVRHFDRALIVTLDYGFPQQKLFHPRARRFGTAAAYSGQRVHRDLLASPGDQDLTAHINFTDLERAGERNGAETLFFDRLAKFLVPIGITRHELFRPVHELTIDDPGQGMELIAAREDARRLVLPDSIGEDLTVLVQGKSIDFANWSFQNKLF
jgi:SAM-dependent MidA family methyltransferase